MNAAPDTALERLAALIGHDPTKAFQRYADGNKKVVELKKRRAEKLADLASLRAQFYGGMTSNYDHERKVLLAELMEARREELTDAGEKVKEAALDSYAPAHPSYKSWLQVQHERRERMHRIEAELAQIDADIEGATGERMLASQAIRLNEELIRTCRTEMGLA